MVVVRQGNQKKIPERLGVADGILGIGQSPKTQGSDTTKSYKSKNQRL